MSKSTKYDNFVYLTICEASLTLFDKSICVTYQNYCNLLRLSLQDGNLSKKEISDIAYIMKITNKIFYMDDKTNAMYVRKFFEEEKYKKFEMAVRYTTAFYPTSIGL